MTSLANKEGVAAKSAVSFLLRITKPLILALNRMSPQRPSRQAICEIVLLTLFVVTLILGGYLCANPELRRLIFPEYFAVLCLLTNEIAWLAVASGPARTFGAQDAERARDVKLLGRFFTLIIIFGLYILIRLGWTVTGQHYRVLYVILIWALSILGVGGVIGFLFGIPRTLSGSAADRQAEAEKAGSSSPGYRVNTNLERVSDWLTQIIVGGTVTQVALFPEHLAKLGNFFANALQVDQIGVWKVAGAGSSLYFGATGFLGSYLITRLYLAGAIQRADGGDAPKAARLSELSRIELEALEAAPLAYDDESTKFEPIAETAAKKILTLSLDQLAHWRDFRVWAKSHLAEGHADDAIKGYAKALEINPNDAESRLGYAIALKLTNNQPKFVLTELEKARDAVMVGTPQELRKNIYKSLIYAVLYLKRPDSFLQALRYAREYFSKQDVVSSGGIYFNIACAYGQLYLWLTQEPEPMLAWEDIAFRPPCPKERNHGPLGKDDLKKQVKALLVEALRLALGRRPDLKMKLVSMIDPAPPAGGNRKQAFEAMEDNDFEILADDESFRKELNDQLHLGIPQKPPQ